MADSIAPLPRGESDRVDPAALQHRPWRKHFALSSGLSAAIAACERFLVQAGFDRAPWLAVGFGGGILAWFWLDNRWQWLALIAGSLALALGMLGLLRGDGRYPYLRQSVTAMAVMVALGCTAVWTKSGLVGAPAIERPISGTFVATVLARDERPAEARVRLVLALRLPDSGRAVRVRVNLPEEKDTPGLAEGARLQVKARLMPPASPMLPGGYDFARSAWFMGLAATGSVHGDVVVLEPSRERPLLAGLQAALSDHVRSQVGGPAGAIAATLASGDRGAIPREDDAAMRDSGLAHLLSISGLHVSALVAGVWVIAIRLLALWPWLALRVRLPLVAAGTAALAGIGYTLLTGAEVPTVRSCIGAVLVLGALAMGREPLSLRLLAAAALFVMALWPEAIVGPSFQMSFAAVLSIIALHGSGPVRRFLAPREEAWWERGLRQVGMLLLTGVVIELALMPIGMFHFHRAGVYGALANVIAIPLTTFVAMPLVALALFMDVVGAGAPVWWLVGHAIDLLLGIAHWTASQPGAVSLMPAMGMGSMALFTLGGLWLALWRGRVRLVGLAPVVVGAASLMTLTSPDLLISGDGRHVGITGESTGELLVLREGKGTFASESLSEIAGMSGPVRGLEQWPGAKCSREFCAITINRGGREWRLLLGRGREQVAERALAAACDRADIVIADRWLPRSCRPTVLKADRRLLSQTGGLSLWLDPWRVQTVAARQGDHGWWRPPAPRPASQAKPLTNQR